MKLSPFWIRVSSCGHGVLLGMVILFITRQVQGMAGQPEEISGVIELLVIFASTATFGFINVSKRFVQPLKAQHP